jgi:hypothetical protein
MDNLLKSIEHLNTMLPSIQKAMKGLENATIMDIAKLDDKGQRDSFSQLMNELKNCKTKEQHDGITEKITKLQKQYAR